MNKYIISFKDNGQPKEYTINSDVTYVISRNSLNDNFSFTFNDTIQNFIEIESNPLSILYNMIKKEGITELKITQYIGERSFEIFNKDSIDIKAERIDLNLTENINFNPDTIKNIQVALVIG